ncbi:hypothetical protein K4K60_008541 [Colletotrichum sp. SAR11_57]|nr:hypothetical protein K4K60_008541 [Colletotrichum sp. SAR11_57]
MADQYPSAEVTGVDLSPIQPTWVPPNLKFQIDDFNQEWTWPKDHFDYIHGRNLEACFTDLPTTMKEAYNHTKPGGYIEFLEFESQARSQVAELPEEHIYRTCYTALITAANKLGKPGENVRTGALQRALEQAGYVDLVHHRWKIPIGGWCADPKLKQLGWTILDFLSDSLEGFGLYLLKEVAGFSYEKCQVMFSEYRAAMRDPRLQSFYYMHVIYARKPEVSKERKAAIAKESQSHDTTSAV